MTKKEIEAGFKNPQVQDLSSIKWGAVLRNMLKCTIVLIPAFLIKTFKS